MKLSEDELKSIWKQESIRAADDRASCLSADLLVRAGEGELDATERGRVAEHIAQCAPCAEEYRIALSVNEWAAQSADQYASLFPARIVPTTSPPNWRARLTGQLNWLRGFSPVAMAVTTALLLLTVALGIWFLTLRQQNRMLVAELEQQRNEAAENEPLRTRIEELERRQSELSQSEPSAQSAEQPAAGQETLMAENERLKRELYELSRPQLDPPQIDVDPHGETRAASGSGKETTFDIPASATSFTINLPGAGSKPYPKYSIELVEARTNRVMWSGQRGQDKETTFTLTLAKRSLPAGRYRIRVTGLNGVKRELIYNYDIRVNYTASAAKPQ
jgi:hypothetical protein